MDLLAELKKKIDGDVFSEGDVVRTYSTDASLFKIKPDAVIFPKNARDVETVVDFVNTHKREQPHLSITARSAGTDMSGGPLNDSLILGFTKYLNHFSIRDSIATVEPGVYYRDFEKATLEKGLLLPSYPASKSLCALGGMVNNNSGGEKTLRYGKTNKYVRKLRMVLADGKEYEFRRLKKEELEAKKEQQDFEGQVYRQMYDLLEKNYDLVKRAKPHVSKNSAGYDLWNIWNRETFDLTQLFVGAQGTLGMMTSADIELIRVKPSSRLAVVFLSSLEPLPKLVNEILPLDPEGLEIFDDETLKLALRFFPSIAKKVHQNLLSFAWQFLPEAWIGVKMLGLPKLTVLCEFAEDSDKLAEQKLAELKKKLAAFPGKIQVRYLHTEQEAEKYWVIRRESFSLLRQHVKGKRTAPFVDDLIVRPEKLPEVLPQIQKVLKEFHIHQTIAGHAGSGNFHIIPLMDLTKKSERDKIPVVADKIYDIILKYGGSITAEHNDGLIRTPYLPKMFGSEVYDLFKQVKHIFDPDNIFNPHKKVGADMHYAMQFLSAKQD